MLPCDKTSENMRTAFTWICMALICAGTSAFGQDVEQGEKLFNANCKACHSIGGGKLVGPDLKGLTERREQDWIIKFIQSPMGMINSEDPVAVQLFEEYNQIAMPDHGHIKEDDIKSLIAYIEEAPKKAAEEAKKAEEAKAAEAKAAGNAETVTAAVAPAPSTAEIVVWVLLGLTIILTICVGGLLMKVMLLVKKV